MSDTIIGTPAVLIKRASVGDLRQGFSTGDINSGVSDGDIEVDLKSAISIEPPAGRTATVNGGIRLGRDSAAVSDSDPAASPVVVNGDILCADTHSAIDGVFQVAGNVDCADFSGKKAK